MFATRKLRIGGTGALALGAVLTVSLLAACATSSPDGAMAPAPEIGQLGRMQIESRGDGTVVTLVGLTEPAFSDFQQDDPARVVVDLQMVEPGDVPAATAVYDGTLGEVTVSAFQDASGQPATRVELGLDTVAGYEVVALEDRLEIHVTRKDVAETMEAESLHATTVEPDPWADSAMAEPWETPAGAAEPEADPVAATLADVSPATALLGVEATPEGTGAVVTIAADGRVDGFTHFVLEDPARLVVDLPGLTSRMADPRVEVGAGGVSRVRVGQHADKVRVVMDADGAETLEDATVTATRDGLVIGVGEAAALAAASAGTPAVAMQGASEPEAAEAVAPETEVEAEATQAGAEPVQDDGASAMAGTADEESGADSTAATAPAGMQVYGVQFDAQPSRDRVVVLSDGKADYSLVRTDPETLMVRMPGASIDPEAAVRIAPEDPGAVSLVTAFDQPGAGEPEVRVVIRRAAGLEPTVSQEGGMLFLDFARGEKVADAVPAAQPGAAAAGAAGKAVAQATAQVADEVPAALDPEGDALSLLEEGGLIDGKKYTGRRISLDFKDVDIEDVLRLVAEVSELNIIAGDEVSGQVTIRLVDVPWDQALDVILLTKGLGFVRVGNVLRIAPAEVLKSEEEARLQERRAKEKLEDLLVKLQPVNYADVKDVEKMVKRLLTPRGTVDVDERTNTIILKDIASVIDEATALIKAIDTQTPQVLIEAKIVEANLDFSREIGSQWAFGAQPLVDGFDSSSADRRDLNIGNDFVFHDNELLSGFTETFNHVSVTNPITSVPTGLLDLGAFLLDEQFNLELRLEAAESHGEGKVISSPRVVTLDNRKASIEQGVSIPFQTFENGDAKLEFIDAVLKLEVTPHITADRSIIMKIEVERNAPDDSVQTPTGSPAIAKNEALTETLVKDGQTLVIGGIYTVEKADRESRVPYFHKIPILGNAFKNHETRDIRKELLVFVTPRVVVNPEVGS